MTTNIAHYWSESDQRTQERVREQLLELDISRVNAFKNNAVYLQTNLDKHQFDFISKLYPGFSIVAGNRPNPHPIAKAQSEIASHLLKLVYQGTGQAVASHGGYPLKEANRRTNDRVFVTHVTLAMQPRDFKRLRESARGIYRKIRSFKQGKIRQFEETRDFLTDLYEGCTKNQPNKSICFGGSFECEHVVPENVIAVNSTEDMSVTDFCLIMAKKGYLEADIHMIVPYVLEKVDHFEDIQYIFQKDKDGTWTQNFVNDNSPSYTHRLADTMSWIKNPLVTAYYQGVRYNYSVEIVARYGFFFNIKIIRIYNPTKFTITNKQVFPLDDFVLVPKASYLTWCIKKRFSKNWYNRNHSKYMLIPRAIYEKVMTLAINNVTKDSDTLIAKIIQDLHVYSSTLKIAGKTVRQGQKLSVSEISEIVPTMLLQVLVSQDMMLKRCNALTHKMRTELRAKGFITKFIDDLIEGFKTIIDFLFSDNVEDLEKHYEDHMAEVSQRGVRAVLHEHNITLTATDVIEVATHNTHTTRYTRTSEESVPSFEAECRKSIKSDFHQDFSVKLQNYLAELPEDPEFENLVVKVRAKFSDAELKNPIFESVVGVAGSGKTSTLLRGLAETNERTLFVASSKALGAEIGGKFSNFSGLCVQTQHRALLLGDYQHVVVDEANTYPAVYISMLNWCNPRAVVHALFDWRQYSMLLQGTLCKDDLIYNYINPDNMIEFNSSHTIPSSVCDFINTIFGTRIKTLSKERGSIDFSVHDSKSFNTHDLKLHFSHKTLDEVSGLGSNAITVRAAQGTRSHDVGVWISSHEEDFVRSHCEGFYVALTRTTNRVVVYLDEKHASYLFNPTTIPIFHNLKFNDDWQNIREVNLRRVEDPKLQLSCPIRILDLKGTFDPPSIREIVDFVFNASNENEWFSAAISEDFVTDMPVRIDIFLSCDFKDHFEFRGHRLKGIPYTKHFFSRNRAQALESAIHRQTKPVFPKMKPRDLKRTASRFVDKLFNKFFDKTSVVDCQFDSEFLTRHIVEYCRDMQDKGTLHLMKEIDPELAHTYRVDFSLKTIHKIVCHEGDPALNDKAGQMISAWTKEMNSVFCSYFRELQLVVNRTLKHKVYLNFCGNERTLDTHLKAFLGPHAGCDSQDCDLSAFDRSQNLFTQRIEFEILQRLGFPMDALTWYFLQREKWTGYCRGAFRLNNEGTKASGEPATLILNTLVCMTVMANVLDADEIYAAYFQGDDSSIHARVIKINQPNVELLKKYCGMGFKFERNAVSHFCGNLLSAYGWYPDLFRMTLKVLSWIHRNEKEFEEKKTAVKDRIKYLSNFPQNNTFEYACINNSVYYSSFCRGEKKIEPHHFEQIAMFLKGFTEISYNDFRQHCYSAAGLGDHSGRYMEVVEHTSLVKKMASPDEDIYFDADGEPQIVQNQSCPTDLKKMIEEPNLNSCRSFITKQGLKEFFVKTENIPEKDLDERFNDLAQDPDKISRVHLRVDDETDSIGQCSLMADFDDHFESIATNLVGSSTSLTSDESCITLLESFETVVTDSSSFVSSKSVTSKASKGSQSSAKLSSFGEILPTEGILFCSRDALRDQISNFQLRMYEEFVKAFRDEFVDPSGLVFDDALIQFAGEIGRPLVLTFTNKGEDEILGLKPGKSVVTFSNFEKFPRGMLFDAYARFTLPSDVVWIHNINNVHYTNGHKHFIFG